MKTIQQINRTITNIRTATKKFKATVQQLTVDIFGHALEHLGMITPKKLYKSAMWITC